MTDAKPSSFDLVTARTPDLRLRVLDLFCDLAYRTGNFTLSSGQQSSYYINGKTVTLHPEGALAIGRLLLPKLPTDTVAVAGLTLGADPIISAVSVVSAYEHRPISGLIVRKEAKGYGTQAYLEGPPLASGSTVVVVEDVVTTGRSAKIAVDRLQAAGYRVSHILALVDRQQGGREYYQQQGLTFESIFTIAEIQDRWVELHQTSLN